MSTLAPEPDPPIDTQWLYMQERAYCPSGACSAAFCQLSGVRYIDFPSPGIFVASRFCCSPSFVSGVILGSRADEFFSQERLIYVFAWFYFLKKDPCLPFGLAGRGFVATASFVHVNESVPTISAFRGCLGVQGFGERYGLAVVDSGTGPLPEQAFEL